MGVNSNLKKTKQLGMPYGTACAKLRKAILFDLLKRHNENVCYKCGKIIENVDALSIEHKHPWEDVDPALFWDLANISFSHRACNRPHRQGGCAQRKIGPEGTAWCVRCKLFKDVDQFGKNHRHWNGLRDRCRPCDAIVAENGRKRKQKKE